MRHGSRTAASPPGSGDGVEVGNALERGQVAAQYLASPQRAVRSVARAVAHHGECRARLAVLGQAGRRVGVVVLHAHELRLLGLGPGRGQVVGVEVVGHHLDLRLPACRGTARGRPGRRGGPGSSRGRRGAPRGRPPGPARRRTCSCAGPQRPRRGGGRPRAARAGAGRSRASAARGRRRAQRSPRSDGGSAGRGTRKASAMSPRRSRASPSSKAIGSSERFPLVITSGPPAPATSRWWSGV